MEDSCIFCKIIKGEIPAEKVYEKNNVIGFKDLNPLAPIHLLFIHKNHTQNLNDLCNKDPQSLIEIFQAINEYTEKNGHKNYGYRVVTNIGATSGQSIFHAHFHILSGAKLGRFGT